MMVSDIGYADGLHPITVQMDNLEFRCGPAGHDYAINGPYYDDSAKRSYDLICPKCGDARTVAVSEG
jgi:hypothetical protein